VKVEAAHVPDNVIPFPARITCFNELPLDEWEGLPKDSWRHGLQYSQAEVMLMIIAVLRQMNPMPVRQLRRGIAMALDPGVVGHFLTAEEDRVWRHLVGREGALLKEPQMRSRPTPDYPWMDAVQQLRGSGRIIESEDGATWSLGHGLEEYQPPAWILGRTRFILAVLGREARTGVAAETIDRRLNEQTG
jgi:hypothetical protein